MLKSRTHIKNPLLKISGRKAAWYLFSTLDYPFDDFERFRKILWAAIVRSPWLYSNIAIPKRDGSKRILAIPHPDLMTIQRAINKNFLELYRHPNVYGFSGGNAREALTALARSNQAIFASDIKDAFPSTTGRAVFNFFRTEKFGYYTSYYLTCLTTWFNQQKKFNLPQVGLPQGAPTSPRLFDLCFIRFDRRFARLTKNANGVYFRYADNIFLTAEEFWPERINIQTMRDGGVRWQSPIISAIYRILKRGYEFEHSPDNEIWHNQEYGLHKSYFARQGQILHALGLNIKDDQLHNTREFKLRVRMTIFNLKKALEQKDDFETKIWPLYHKLDGMQKFLVKETSSKLWEEAEQALFQVALIRYSGQGGRYVKNISEY
ncbi:hypothetical protein JW977_04550 [Candidatus Falkowbacteria bacterium]|nr:hypothetical protein [Candidatus Falkowbacteria bacterium]